MCENVNVPSVIIQIQKIMLRKNLNISLQIVCQDSLFWIFFATVYINRIYTYRYIKINPDSRNRSPTNEKIMLFTNVPVWICVYQFAIVVINKITREGIPISHVSIGKCLKNLCTMCRREDLNLHGLPRLLLRQVRLPFRHSGFCPPSWSRTNDQSLKRRVLYQLSYGRKILNRLSIPFIVDFSRCFGVNR